MWAISYGKSCGLMLSIPGLTTLAEPWCCSTDFRSSRRLAELLGLGGSEA